MLIAGCIAHCVAGVPRNAVQISIEGVNFLKMTTMKLIPQFFRILTKDALKVV